MSVLHEYNGDIAPVVAHHDSLCKYYENIEAHWNYTGCASFHEGNMYGDWVVPPPAPMGNKSLIGEWFRNQSAPLFLRPKP